MHQWAILQNQIGEYMRQWQIWSCAILSSLVVGCAGGGTAPSPTQRLIVWTWEPGSCADAFHLYEVVNGQSRRLTTTVTPRYQQRMVVRKSEWIVGGVCADGTEAVSVPAQLQ